MINTADRDGERFDQPVAQSCLATCLTGGHGRAGYGQNGRPWRSRGQACGRVRAGARGARAPPSHRLLLARARACACTCAGARGSVCARLLECVVQRRALSCRAFGAVMAPSPGRRRCAGVAVFQSHARMRCMSESQAACGQHVFESGGGGGESRQQGTRSRRCRS